MLKLAAMRALCGHKVCRINIGTIEITGFLDGKELSSNSQILKFEMIQSGNRQSLIVKNVTQADYCKYTANCNGEKKEASLMPKKAFLQKMQDVKGYTGGISVFECEVNPGTQVTWYFGTKKITTQNFR